jgi:hypothetical protein
VHVLVAAAFLGPCPDGQEVRHLDGDKLNNCLDNLIYGTRSENNLDTVRHGHHKKGLPKTHCSHGHEYTPENIYMHKKGDSFFRECLTCRSQRNRASVQ